MNYEEVVEQLNLEIDSEESQLKAKEIKKKLHKIGLILFITSISLTVISLVLFFYLMIAGLRTLNPTLLYSIIPFAVMVFSIFGIIFGYSYLRLAKQVILKDEINE